MNNIEEKNVGEWVAKDYRTAAVFQNYGIDFCCNGNRSIEKACEENKINPLQLKSDLRDIILSGDHSREGDINYNSWPLDLLADYIEKKHHRYVNLQIPVLEKYLDKLCAVHGKNHPELFEIRSLFHESATEFIAHMKAEEQILFPIIRKLVVGEEPGMKNANLGSATAVIERMMQEHDVEGERFRKISLLSHHYLPPADACSTYKVAFSLLKEFEDDLHLHVHLENNILFRKAMEMESAALVH